MIKKSVMIFLAILLLTLQTAVAQIYEDDDEGPSPAEKIAALAKPATVQIETTAVVSLKIPDLKIEQGKIVEIGEPKQREYTERFTGTGLIITPDGYIVTNAHVVQAELEELLPGFLQTIIANLNIPPTHNAQTVEHIKKNSEPKLIIKEVAVLLPITGPNGFSQHRIPADIRAQGKGYPGKDVAILKIPAQNLPTINIAHLDTPPVGAPILVIGYPAAAKIGMSLNEATLTSGIVSAYKKADEGWRLMQIDAAISGGNSGGPVFDKKGHVIGLATLKSSKDAGFNWVVPNEIIYEFLAQANVKPTRGTLDKIYEHAINYYWQRKYTQAIVQLRYVLDIMPNHPLAPAYLLQSRLVLEQQESGFSLTLIIILVTFGIIAFLCVFFFIEKKKHHHRRKR